MRLGGRAWTWLFYVPATVASCLFAIVGLVTFGDLAQVQYEPTAGNLGAQLNGAMAATFIAPVLTAGLVIMSFFVLVKKTWSRSGAGFTYGFCTAYFLNNSMFLLLTGVVLTANKHWTSQFEAAAGAAWTSSSTNAYVATYILAFISCCFNLVVGAAMISNRKSFGGAQLTVDELGLADRLRSGTSPSSSAVAGPPAPPYTDHLPATRSAPGSSGAWNAV